MSIETSVLLALYNSRPFLAELMQSLANQTYQDFELLIGDDGSTDDSPALALNLAASHGIPARLIPSTHRIKPAGPAQQFARLASASSARYLSFCDHDDSWQPDKLQRAVSSLQRQEEDRRYACYHSNATVVNSKLQRMHESFWRYQNGDPGMAASFARQLTQNHVLGCTVAFNQPLNKILWPLPPEAIMHDYWVSLVASAAGAIEYDPVATLLYRQHAGNQVGAVQSGWRKLSQSHTEIRHRMHQKMEQADAFATRYRDSFPEASRLAEAFADLRTGASKWRKIRRAAGQRFRLDSVVDTAAFYALL